LGGGAIVGKHTKEYLKVNGFFAKLEKARLLS